MNLSNHVEDTSIIIQFKAFTLTATIYTYKINFSTAPHTFGEEVGQTEKLVHHP